MKPGSRSLLLGANVSFTDMCWSNRTYSPVSSSLIPSFCYSTALRPPRLRGAFKLHRVADQIFLGTDFVNDNYFYAGYVLGHYTERNCPR